MIKLVNDELNNIPDSLHAYGEYENSEKIEGVLDWRFCEILNSCGEAIGNALDLESTVDYAKLAKNLNVRLVPKSKFTQEELNKIKGMGLDIGTGIFVKTSQDKNYIYYDDTLDHDKVNDAIIHGLAHYLLNNTQNSQNADDEAAVIEHTLHAAGKLMPAFFKAYEDIINEKGGLKV